MKINIDFHHILCCFLIIVVLFTFSFAKSSNDTYNTFLDCLNKQTSSKNISKILYSKTNNKYTSVLQSHIRNLRFTYPTTPKPLLIVTPLNPSQVSASVVCSKKLGLHLKIRSGGHDYEGLSYVSDDQYYILLDMTKLNDVRVDTATGTAYVEAGASLGEFYYKIVSSSNVHGFPAGVGATVGIGGHFSGGGLGNMVRKYGLTVDHIIDAEVVDYKGRILNRSSMGEDLFWAIRGGGGASFAVVLSYTVKLVPVPETVTVFNVQRFLTDDITNIVYKWQSVMNSIDENLFVRLIFQTVKNPENQEKDLTIRVIFTSHFLGDSETLVNLLNSELPELGIRKEDCQETSWAKGLLFWLGHNKETPLEVLLNTSYIRYYVKTKSDFVQKPIEKHDLELLWKKLIKLEKPALVFSPYGGRMNEIPSSATPFPHRNGNLYMIEYSTSWKDEGKDIEEKNIGLSRELYEFMTPYVSKNPRGAVLNLRDIDIGVNHNGSYKEGEVYGKKYFLGNFHRLVRVKSKVDPDNFFRYEQSIPIRHHKEYVDYM